MPASHCTLTTDQRGDPRPDEAADGGACDIGAVEGTGPAPTISLSASSLDFGTESVDYFGVTQTVTLTNNSAVPLFLSSTGITITGTNPEEFLETDTCAGTTIAPGTSCTIDVNFVPQATGRSTGALFIYDNAADSPQMVSLSGTGTLPATNTPVPPGATPTNAPVPPTTQPTATPTRTMQPTGTMLVVCHGALVKPAPPPLSVGIAPHRALVAGSSHGPAPSRTLRYVTGGGTLPLLIRTAPHATVTASLDVVATQVVIHGAGAQRTRTTRRVVLYHTVLRGTADAHGRYSPQMHVAYQANGPVVATLTVWAQASCGTATKRTTLTILPLRITVTPHRLVGGSPLTITLHTGVHGQVSITLEVDTTRDTVMGQGTQRHRVRQVVALYRLRVTGTADAHGRFSRRVAIAYQPRTPLLANVAVTVRLPQGTATGGAMATLLPRRHH